MTADIINIADRRKPASASPKWSCDIRVWTGAPGETLGQITDSDAREGEDAGDRLRRIAGELDHLAFLLVQQAEEISPSDDGICIAKASVYESSRVRVRVHDGKVVTAEQEEWIRERLEDAKGAVGR